MNNQKPNTMLYVSLAVNVFLVIIIIMLLFFCFFKADSHAEQKEPYGHETEATEKQEEVTEKKAEGEGVQKEKTDKPAKEEVLKPETENPPQEKVVMFTVAANKKWQFCGIAVTPEMHITIAYEKGKWAMNNDYVDAEGYPGLGLSFARAYPSLTFGALIGQVGINKPFEVGNYCEIDGSGMTGKLALRMNNQDGWTNNYYGSITVKITIYK
ncbi:MAG: hypothetical protein JW822_03675 [Spirochaetales bacterium]|nr:hypothetical protein [Spirochaetales bacterium]